MKRSSVLVVALIAACVLPGVAGAAQITQTATIPATTTELNTSKTFAQFDRSLGTLDSVQVSFTGGLSTVLTVKNNAATSSDGTAKTEVQFTVADPGNFFGPDVPQIDLNSAEFPYSLAAGAQTTSGTLTKNGSFSNTYTDAAILSEFTGSGNINLGVSTFTRTWLGNNGGNTTASQATQANWGATVIYNYTVPEPASLSLLTLGGLLLRRRKH